MYNDSALATTKSQHLFEKAQQYIPGGVNSPMRAFKSVGGTPRLIQSAQGAYLTDEDGQRYIDYVGAFGCAILGHAYPTVIKKITEACHAGLCYGASCKLEIELAQKICDNIPSIEKIRFVSSGTEATMTAIRLARGVTGRTKIIKFIGCYHGHSDGLLVKAGSGVLDYSEPSSPGVPVNTVSDTLTASYNDLDSVTALFEKHGKDIAAIIVEPIAANMNLVLPKSDFLSGLRQICDQYGSLLIFDEIVSGFRIGLQGAQGLYSIRPDLTTLGKIIGGGMPIGAVGGARAIMEQLSPQGPIYQAGTFSGNPISMAAGLATIQELKKPGVYQSLAENTKRLIHGIALRAQAAKVALTINSCCGIFGLFFSEEKQISSYHQVMACDQAKFRQFFHGMLDEGIYLAPSMFEAGFLSLFHQEEEINQTLEAIERAL